MDAINTEKVKCSLDKSRVARARRASGAGVSYCSVDAYLAPGALESTRETKPAYCRLYGLAFDVMGPCFVDITHDLQGCIEILLLVT